MIIDLNLKNKQVIVVGGGNESARKVEALLTQSCEIIVIADVVDKSIKKYAEDGKLILERIKINNANYLNKYKNLILILATTDNRELNREIVLFGKSIGCYVYAADDPDFSDFSHPSVINVKDLIQVAISTGGRSPLIGKTLRKILEPIINSAVSDLIINQIKLQEQFRAKAKSILLSSGCRKDFLIELMCDEKVNQLLSAGDIIEAEKLASELLNLHSNKFSSNGILNRE